MAYSAGFTLDTYAHVTTAAQRNAANTMGNVLSCAVRQDFPYGSKPWSVNKAKQERFRKQDKTRKKHKVSRGFWYALRDSNSRPSGP